MQRIFIINEKWAIGLLTITLIPAAILSGLLVSKVEKEIMQALYPQTNTSHAGTEFLIYFGLIVPCSMFLVK